MNLVTRIVIADDHQLFAESLKFLLIQKGGYQHVDLFQNGRDLLDYVSVDLPDLLILDINMPKVNGLAVLKHLEQSASRPKILVLSTYGDQYLVDLARNARADGYMRKNFASESFLYGVEQILAGQKYFPAAIVEYPEPTFADERFSKQFKLTRREREIISMLKIHMTNLEISQRLFLSPYTVDTHRKNIMHKLGLKSPSALMEYIIENQL